MSIINIDIMDKVNNEDYWTPEPGRKIYTRHMYRHSPYESCDSCGNCNGACCDTCEATYEPSSVKFTVQSDTLYAWLIEKDIPKDIASYLVYSDYYSLTYKGYHLVWPSEYMLQIQYPDLYTQIISIDSSVVDVINTYKGKYTVYADLKDAVLRHYGLDEYTYHGHIVNQLELYWERCGHVHSVACGK